MQCTNMCMFFLSFPHLCPRKVVDALLCTYLSFLYSPAALGLSAMLHATLSLASTWAQARNDGEGGGAYLIMIS